MTRQALFVVRIQDDDRLVQTSTDLQTVSGLATWYAVDGQANLVAVVKGSSDPFMDYLGKRAGQVAVTMCEILSGEADFPEISPDKCQAWVFADVESSKLEELCRSLKDAAEVSLVWQARGGCDLIALVSGKSLDEVDRVIAKMQTLDGILRLKRNRIINLTAL